MPVFSSRSASQAVRRVFPWELVQGCAPASHRRTAFAVYVTPPGRRLLLSRDRDVEANAKIPHRRTRSTAKGPCRIPGTPEPEGEVSINSCGDASIPPPALPAAGLFA